MTTTERDTRFDEVMARIERKLDQHGLTERDASLQATGKPDLIRDMRRRRGMPGSERLDSLAALLGTTSDWLLRGGAEDHSPPVRTEVAAAGIADVERAWRGPGAARPVPLLGSAVGGEYDGLDESIELTELHLSEIFDYLARPPSLAGDKAAYAVTIVGDSMAPRFEPGERVFVSPRSPVGIGDDVIVQLRGGGEDQDADRVTMVLIKRLVRRTAKELELRQFNPDRTFRVPLEKVAAIHRVRGRL